jgi:hypothetical protein
VADRVSHDHRRLAALSSGPRSDDRVCATPCTVLIVYLDLGDLSLVERPRSLVI